MWHIWCEMAPWLLLGSLVGGLMHILLPSNWIERQLRGGLGVLRAVILGVPLPLCSCGVIPTGLSLKKHGAQDGPVVAFLVSTPQTGVDSILVSGSMLGWPFAFFKVLTAVVLGVVGGLWASKGQSPGAREPDTEVVKRRNLWAMIRHMHRLVAAIWHWLVLGVFVSAMITTFIPQNQLVEWGMGNTWLAGLLALIISLPLYVCATASVPIAASLVVAGLPVGAALVFLIAGPATNVSTMGAVYRTLGRMVFIKYLIVLIVGSLLAGWTLDSFLKLETACEHIHEHSGTWWAIASGIVLAIWVGFSAGLSAQAYLRKKRGSCCC